MRILFEFEIKMVQQEPTINPRALPRGSSVRKPKDGGLAILNEIPNYKWKYGLT
jgi:hypothetical protein